jgi:hypothetical protein
MPANVGESSAAEAEPNAFLQWNMKAIRADAAHDAGNFGCGVARARVAVVDQGVYAQHVDIAPNLNTALSRSFVPSETGFEFVPDFTITDRTRFSSATSATARTSRASSPRPSTAGASRAWRRVPSS